MWFQFFLEQFHFAVYLLMALILFAVFWLYLDAWLARKTWREGIRFSGFLLLSLGFLFQATVLESNIVPNPFFSHNLQTLLVAAFKIPGYLAIITSLFLDPIQRKPGQLVPLIATPVSAPVIFSGRLFLLFYPLSALTVACIYLYQATFGLERHLRLLAIGFFMITLSELLRLIDFFQTTTNVSLYNLTAAFGPLWILGHLFLMIATLIIGRWVFGYLLKRFEMQLFIIFMVVVVVIFLITTVTFTSLLLKNIQDETLIQLNTDVRVLEFGIDSKKIETLSDAQVIAQNPTVISLVSQNQRPQLAEIVEQYLLTKKQSFLVVVNQSGQVLARGDDKNRYGDSLAADSLIQRSLADTNVSSIVSKDGVLAPELSVRSATAIKNGNQVIGAVIVGTVLDTAFVEGVKKATGLESSLYAGNLLSATTLLAADGVSRPIGIVESHSEITKPVLKNGRNYQGTVNLIGVPYFGAYLPLIDVNDTPLGMLFVGRPQVQVLAAAGRSFEVSFLMVITLLILSIVPAHQISKSITRQVH